METMQLIIELASLITAITIITGILKKYLERYLKKIESKMDEKDYKDSKIYLTDFLHDIELNIQKDEEQKRMASEIYDHYVKPKEKGGLDGNSWVKEKWERLMK